MRFPRIALLAAVSALTGCLTMTTHSYERQARETSTPELKLRENELVEETSGMHFQFGGYYNDQDFKVAERTAIEHELLRRYEAGEKDAYLPIFGG